MSIFPRWVDDFSTDPTSDPTYDISGNWTYNGTLDRMEYNTSGPASNIELLDSKNSFGLFECEFFWDDFTGVNAREYMAFRAFGYLVTYGLTAGGATISFIYSENEDPASINTGNPSENSLISLGNPSGGTHNLQIIATPNGVDFFLDNIFRGTLPSKVVNTNVLLFAFRNSGVVAYHINNFKVLSDASLPLGSTIIEPGLAGSVAGVDGPIIIDIPESRLYLDLGAFAGQIMGLSNVVYDPGGSAVAMAEDSGIPDGSGGTVGDYYLEIPSREVASDHRLVIKEDFVTTNSVLVGDDIDFDVDGGPSTQNQLILEEDDLQCFIQKDQNNKFHRASLRDFLPNGIVANNIGADGNTYILAVTQLFLDVNTTGGGSGFVETSGPFSFPFLVDIDLGKIRKVKSLYFHSDEVVNAVNFMKSCTGVYSNTVAFSGDSLLQGTLEVSNLNPFTHITSEDPTPLADNLLTFPEITIVTRFLRLEFQSADLASPSAPRKLLGAHLIIQAEEFEIDSVNDNAQFEHEPASGGGFVTFPAGGVTQQDGQVRITLPTDLEVEPGSTTDFYNIFFKPDITD